jgi:hypothetical protein
LSPCAFAEQFPASKRKSTGTAEVDSEAPILAAIIGRRPEMLYTLAVILLIAWFLGLVGTYTIGAFVHLLLVVAIILFLVGFITGRRPVI